MKKYLSFSKFKRVTIKKFLIVSAFLTGITPLLLAQTGSIKGTVVDAVNNEPLIGASVVITGTTNGSKTDLDGNYHIKELKPGTYSVTISYISYTAQVRENIMVEADKETVLNVLLESADISLSEVKVVAKANRESENILLLEQKEAVLSTQAVGAKEMSRKGINNAEAAVAQVSGISKQEGVKNVFVRGLGDRYNATTLNGFPIPSEDPEYKNIALDFFGSDVIKNVGVNKVYSSTNYSDVSGAIINIESKELVKDQELQIDGSVKFNTETFNSEFIRQNGVNYFGFANKTEPSSNLTDFSFSNKLNPIRVSLPMNHSYGIAGGKKVLLGIDENPLTFFVVATHSTGYAYTKQIIKNTNTQGEAYEDLLGEKHSMSTNQLILGNVNLRLRNKHNIAFNVMLVHNNEQYVGNYFGLNSERYQSAEEFGSLGYLIRQQTNDNLLITNQLMGEFMLSDKWALDAGVSYNSVNGSEPDRRVNNFSKSSAENEFTLTKSTGNQQRYFSNLIENDFNAKMVLNYKLSDKFDNKHSGLKFGYQGRYVNDDFQAIEYDFTPIDKIVTINQTDDIDLDKLYSAANLQKGEYAIDRNKDIYQVNKLINTGFVDVTYRLAAKLIANVGVRVDFVNLLVDYDVDRGGLVGDSKINKSFVLPSFNLKYELTDEHALRLGLSKTYTLPQSKEISPYKYMGINFRSQGNVNLQPSDNYNLDLKWDWYITPSELISLTGFYKHIVNPIARVEEGGSGGYLTYKNVSKYATIAGVELEARKNIFSKVNTAIPKVNRLSVGFNASYIYTNLTLDVLNTVKRETLLEGASPYIVNTDLSYFYQYKNFSTTNSVVLKYFSDRIYTIGTIGFKDIIEKSVPTLDFISTTQLNSHWAIKINAKNILNPSYVLSRKPITGSENIVLSDYKKGINIGVGFTYTF